MLTILERIWQAIGVFIGSFILIMILNQALFFNFCLKSYCLSAATPHVLVISIIIALFSLSVDL